MYTVFLQSDAVATVFFTACFCADTIQDGIYFFRKPTDINNGLIRHVRAIQ